jgi:hypothetical protein
VINPELIEWLSQPVDYGEILRGPPIAASKRSRGDIMEGCHTPPTGRGQESGPSPYQTTEAR